MKLSKIIAVVLLSVILCMLPIQSIYAPIAEQNLIPSPTPAMEPKPTPFPDEYEGLEELRERLGFVNELNGEWSVYVKNLKTNEYLTINECQLPSASLIKLFIMAGVYKKIEDGSLQKSDDIKGKLNLMITESDNDASNELSEILGDGDIIRGFEFENENTRALDCTYTLHQTDLQDNRANSTIEFLGRNYTSARDCGHLLELIYNKKLYGEENSNEMLELLKAQEHTYKIPSGVPEGVTTANKTGETSSIQNDAAIVFSPACDYIITVLSNESYDEEYAINKIQGISSEVYNYFNGE